MALTEWSQLLGRQISVEEYEPVNSLLAALGRSTSAPDYLESVLWLEGFRRRTIAFWSEQGFDLLCTPVLAQPPARLGELSDPVNGAAKEIETLQFTGQFNVSGQPAASLPLHWSPGGLPIGVQLVADYGREDVLIRVCEPARGGKRLGGPPAESARVIATIAPAAGRFRLRARNDD